ncbi:MAG: DUF3786 domain-containing protein [Firmicutes bacterium]|nr:DUF3786 domain-containing protein [Bacillota bacterium]
MNLEITRRQAVRKLAALDPEKIARCCRLRFEQEQQYFLLPFLNREYRISYPEGKVYTTRGEEAPIYPSLIMLHYLVTADGEPLAGEWISFRHLPGGGIYMEPFRKRALDPFLKIYGHQPRAFLSSATILGGYPGSLNGINRVIPVLPCVPLLFILWPGDEELPPSANILFDRSAPAYLPTEDYAHLPGMVIKAMGRSRLST